MVLSAILSYRSVKSWLRVEGRHPVSNLLGYRYEANGPVWGFLPAGLKEVLKGVGDFQALVVEQADRERKKKQEKAVALRRARLLTI